MAELRAEYGPDFELFRVERACPCGHCGRFDADSEPRPGWLAELMPEVRELHDAHTARVLALWEVKVWGPEARAVWLLALASVRLTAAERAVRAASLAVRRSASRPAYRSPSAARRLLVCLNLAGAPCDVRAGAGSVAMPP